MPREYSGAVGGDISGGHVLGDNFEASLERFKIKSMEQAELIIKKAVFAMYNEIVNTAPVDTGLFRASNQIGIGSIPTGNPIADAPGGGKYPRGGSVTYDFGPSVETAKANLENYKLDSVIYICNNLKYAVMLEYGHSSLAPTGVYRKAALKLTGFLNTAAAGGSPSGSSPSGGSKGILAGKWTKHRSGSFAGQIVKP